MNRKDAPAEAGRPERRQTVKQETGKKESRKEYRSSEDYLEAILLVRNRDKRCRRIDVARQLGFSKPSVSNAVAKLEAEGLVERGEDGDLLLTENGERIAQHTLEKHEFFASLFERLGVDRKTAQDDACALEHNISDESYQALSGFILRILPPNS